MVEHEFEEASRTEPTTEAEGEIVYKCKNCEETKTEAIPVLSSGCIASAGIDLGVISVALGAVAMFFARKTKKD